MSSATSWAPTPWKDPTQASSFTAKTGTAGARSRINCWISAVKLAGQAVHRRTVPQAVEIVTSSYKRLAVLRAENAKLLDKIASCGWWTAQSAI